MIICCKVLHFPLCNYVKMALSNESTLGCLEKLFNMWREMQSVLRNKFSYLVVFLRARPSFKIICSWSAFLCMIMIWCYSTPFQRHVHSCFSTQLFLFFFEFSTRLWAFPWLKWQSNDGWFTEQWCLSSVQIWDLQTSISQGIPSAEGFIYNLLVIFGTTNGSHLLFTFP